MAENPTVLIVDNRKAVAEKISAALSKKGIGILLAPDIRRAFRIFQRENPQIILQKVDDATQEISQRFIRRIKSIDGTANFIVLCDAPSLESVVKFLKAGASDYLAEPLDMTDLVRRIHQIFMKKRVQRENVLLSDLASLHENAISFFSTQESESLLPLVLETFLQITKADSGAIFFWNENEPHLRLEYAKGQRRPAGKEASSREILLLCERVLARGKPLLFPEEDSRVPIAGLEDLEVSVLCLPLLAGRKRIGAIFLSRRPSLGSFVQRDLSVAQVMAQQAAIAISNAQDYCRLSTRVTNLREIQSFGESLMRLTEHNQIVDVVLSSLLRAFGAEVSGLLLPVRRRYELHLSSTRKMASSFVEGMIDQILASLQGKGIHLGRQKIRTIHRIGVHSKQSFLEQRIVRNHSSDIAHLDEHGRWIGALYIGASRKDAFDENMRGQFASIAHQTYVSLMNARLYEELRENHLRTIKALAIAVDAKDKYTRGHSENVMKYALAITEEMGILHERIHEDILNAALLHDIGKIGIPGYILNKPGKLSAEEFNTIMKNHVTVGANIIQEIPFLRDLVPLIRHHHERYDGLGYPDGLKGDEIPVGARILTVADSFEAMTSNRPYRKALSREEAIEELRNNKGSQFDPYIVDIFLAVLKKSPRAETGESRVAQSGIVF